MAQVIQIKRTQNAVGDKKLHSGELAYSSNEDVLYIGSPDQTINNDTLLGTEAPVEIGGTAYTAMLTPSKIDTAGALVLGDSGITADPQDANKKIFTEQKEITVQAPDEVTANYSIVLPKAIGIEGQVLSIHPTGLTETSAPLEWAEVTSTIQDADDSLVSNPQSGQVLIYRTDMDGADVTKILVTDVHAASESFNPDTEISLTVAVGMTIQGTTDIVAVDTAVNGQTIIVQSNPLGAGWINSDLFVVDSDGTTTIGDAGSQSVKDFLEDKDKNPVLTLGGNLVVQGTTTHVNSTAVSMRDKNLALGISGGMSDDLPVVIGTDGSVVINPFVGQEDFEVGDFIYVGDGSDKIPAGSYPVTLSQSGVIQFLYTGYDGDQVLLEDGETLSVSRSKVSDELANNAGFLIPGGENGVKSLLFNSTDDAFVSNQNFEIDTDALDPTDLTWASVADDVVTAFSIEDKVFGSVTKTWDSTVPEGATDPIGMVETFELGSAGVTWGGDPLGVLQGGIGLTSVAKGDILYSDDTNSLTALNGLGIYDETDNNTGLHEVPTVGFAEGPVSAILTISADNTLKWETKIDGGEF